MSGEFVLTGPIMFAFGVGLAVGIMVGFFLFFGWGRKP